VPHRIDIGDDETLALIAAARAIPSAALIRKLTGLHGRGPHMCPLPDHKHDSRSASAFIIYPSTRGWWCFSCGRGGNAVDFLAMYRGMTKQDAAKLLVGDRCAGGGFEVALFDLDEKREDDAVRKRLSKLDYGQLATRMHDCRDAFWRNDDRAASRLCERWQVSLEHLKYNWRVGWSSEEQRYWFPVYDVSDRLVDVRRRSETEKPKVKSMRGFGVGGHLFGESAMSMKDDRRVVIVGGEKDAVIASYHLPEFLFVSGTLGEGSWNEDTMSEPLRGRLVTVFYDNDDAGRHGSAIVVKALVGRASEIRVVRWPLFDPAAEAFLGDISDLILADCSAVACGLIDKAPVVHRDVLEEVLRGR